MSRPLPFELWAHIASFIPLEDIKRTRLYALNPPFLALYLRERYKTLYLRFASGSCYSAQYHCTGLSRKLNHINSMIAENVRTLSVVFEQHSFKPEYEDSTSKLLHFIRKNIIFKYKMKQLRNSFPSYPQIQSALSELKGLTTVKCTLYAENPPFIFDSQRLLTSGISTAWAASRETLTCLVLTIKIYPLIDLGLDAITFPHLQHFSLILLSDCFSVLVGPLDDFIPRGAPNISAVSMSRFLQRHKSTLEILTLVFPVNAQKFAADLLNQLPILQSLWKLKLHFIPDGVIRSPSLPLGLFKTLQSNSQSLRDLHLVFDNLFGSFHFLRGEDSQNYRDWWIAQSFEKINFPNLQTLRLDFDGALSDTPLILQFAVSPTATFLDLRPRIDPSYIHRLSELYAKLKGGCQLETLQLSIKVLLPSVLSSLAYGFPNIKTLKIQYYCVGIEDWIYDPELFMEEISKTRYPNWALENIYLYNPSPQYDPPLFRQTIARILPRVRSIAILPVEAYSN